MAFNRTYKNLKSHNPRIFGQEEYNGSMRHTKGGTGCPDPSIENGLVCYHGMRVDPAQYFNEVQQARSPRRQLRASERKAIKDAMAAKGIRTNQIAEVLTCSPGAFQNYMNGKNKISEYRFKQTWEAIKKWPG